MRRHRCSWFVSRKVAADRRLPISDKLPGETLAAKKPTAKNPGVAISCSGVSWCLGWPVWAYRISGGRRAEASRGNQPWRLLVWIYRTSRNTVGTSTNIRLATKPRSLVSIARAFSAMTVSPPHGADQASSSLVVVWPDAASPELVSASSSSSLSCTGQAVGPAGRGWALA